MDKTDPLRIAIVGAGPAGFYAAEHLLKQADGALTIDLIDRLPTPFGLVRSGVAPDHQKIKSVTRVFERTAGHEAVRFFGNLTLGEHFTLDDLGRHYHQVLLATGAQTDRALGIPGEDLEGSHSATEFVAWYNCHPDYCDHAFDLSAERAVVVGNGNVAVDVARILGHDPDDLAATDIADEALDALRRSRIREIVMLGRRGPAQAAFTPPELRELGEMGGADVAVVPEEVALDPLSRADLDAGADRTVAKNVEIVQAWAHRAPDLSKPRRIVLRFLVSPVEILGEGGRVAGVRLVHNELYRDDRGTLRPRPTAREEILPCGLVFRAVGYRGVALPGLPFDARSGTVPNDEGRVLDPATGAPLPGFYVTGWIKRGPNGVIGTNKPDAAETAAHLLEDARAGRTLQPAAPDPAAAEAFFRSRQPHLFTYDDWHRLDTYETEQGAAAGRVRRKVSRLADMFSAIGRGAS